jgi:drug/metabolite transporter (DMT)-like permease
MLAITDSWIFWTLLAASMQSIRFAGQKYLTADVSAFAATLVRYLFGLPFIVAWLAYLLIDRDFPDVNLTFLLSGLVAGILQIVATVLLIRLFTLRNFAVGSTLVRTEIVVTAVIGFFFFAETISLTGWLAILVCMLGVMLISVARTGTLTSLWDQAALYGVLSAVCFSMTSLLIRKASLSFGLDDHLLTAAMTLGYMVALQTVVCLVWLLLTERQQFTRIARRWRPSLFIGVTSVIGSAGWFTAFTLEFASYVKTLGQIEFLFTLVISMYFFRERPSRVEVAGMLFILGGVIVLLLT